MVKIEIMYRYLSSIKHRGNGLDSHICCIEDLSELRMFVPKKETQRQ